MRGIWKTLLELLIPPSRHVVTATSVTTDMLGSLLHPTNRVLGGITITTLLPYQNPTVRSIINANKFHHDAHSAYLLAHILTTYLGTYPKTSTILVPIPLSPKRLQERGYNQVSSILKYVTDYTTSSILVRKRDTSPQTKLSRADRLRNVAGAFHVTTIPPSEIQTIILIDDVVTTGATLGSAARELAVALAPTQHLIVLAIADAKY